MSSTLQMIMGVGVAAVIASTASASINVDYLGLGYGKSQSVSYNSTVQWNQAGSGPFYSLSAFDHHWVDTDTNQQFIGWCIQLYQGITIGNAYTFDVVALENAPQAPLAPGPMGVLQAGLMRDLFARWADTAPGTIVPEANLANTNSKAAAFALAIWEISHENFTAVDLGTLKSQMSLTLGGLRVNATADVLAYYNAMHASLGVGGWLYADVDGLVNSSAQDQARLVPAPGALALIGLAGLFGARRRK
ncbi:MAG: hypothetical protein SGJ11_09185 [Phycisphaerae bacterium]|nr:hypothetical protein [Phycisphaerae bacterium]